MEQEDIDESLANLEKAGLIKWDRGADLITLTDLGKEVGELIPKDWEIEEKVKE